jgi:hypothetical protein
MMKRLAVLAIAATLVACDSDSDNPAGPSPIGPLVFTAQLLASSEVPPVTNAESSGSGAVTITVAVPRDTAGNPTGPGTAAFAMQAQGFTPGTPIVGAHIHPGASGVNGGVIVNTNIGPTAPVVLADGTANLIVTNIGISQALATQIMNNPAGFYFNMHTPLNPGGAIRGQLSRLQ